MGSFVVCGVLTARTDGCTGSWVAFVALALSAEEESACPSVGAAKHYLRQRSVFYFLSAYFFPAGAAPRSNLFVFVVRVQLRSPGFHLGAGLRATVRPKTSAVSSYLHMLGAWFPPLTN